MASSLGEFVSACRIWLAGARQTSRHWYCATRLVAEPARILTVTWNQQWDILLTVRSLSSVQSAGSQRREGMGFQAKREILTMSMAPALVPEMAPIASPSLAEMIERIAEIRPESGSEALRELRAAFPDSPLALRVAALDALLRRRAGSTELEF